MNGRDVLMTTSLLLTGLVIGYLMGRNVVVTSASSPSPSAADPALAAANPQIAPKESSAPLAPTPPTRVAPEAQPTAPPAPPEVAPTAPPARPPKQLYPFSLSGVPLLGEPAKAKVAVILFSDFQ